MLPLLLGRAEAAPIKLLVLGAHADDAEIGCGGTVLKLIDDGVVGSVCWVVLSGRDERADEARVSAEAMLAGAPESQILQPGFRDGFFPYDGAGIKAFFEELKDFQPDLILTHQRHDLHQDHRIACELTWNTFRNHFILEYEVPKYDGDMGAPERLRPARPGRSAAQDRAPDDAFRDPAAAALVHRGPLLGADAAARHGVPVADVARRGVLQPQGRARLTTSRPGRAEVRGAPGR